MVIEVEDVTKVHVRHSRQMQQIAQSDAGQEALVGTDAKWLLAHNIPWPAVM